MSKSDTVVACKDCGSTTQPRRRMNGECPACASHHEAEKDLQAARFISQMKVRDPNGSIRPILDRAASVLRISAQNHRSVARSLGAKHRP